MGFFLSEHSSNTTVKTYTLSNGRALSMSAILSLLPKVVKAKPVTTVPVVKEVSTLELLAKPSLPTKEVKEVVRPVLRSSLSIYKEAHQILGFGGHVIYSLDNGYLADCIQWAKQAGEVAFQRATQEYFLACRQAGFDVETIPTSWFAKKAYEMAVEAETKEIKSTLIELLRDELESNGVVVHNNYNRLVQRNKQLREVSAQATVRTNRNDVREQARKARQSEGHVFYADPTLPVGTKVEAKPQGKGVTGKTLIEKKAVHKAKLVKAEAKANRLGDSVKKERAVAYVEYLNSLVANIDVYLSKEITKEELTLNNMIAMDILRLQVSQCRVVLASTRKAKVSAMQSKINAREAKARSRK